MEPQTQTSTQVARPAPTWKDLPPLPKGDRTVYLMTPTRGMIDAQIISGWLGLQEPHSFPRRWMFANDARPLDEKYEGMVRTILEKSPTPYIMSVEDDNWLPPHALLHLLRSIHDFDVVGALYYTKSQFQHTPLVFDENEKVMDISGRSGVVESSVVPMGCTLFRASVFRDLPQPWFKTVEPDAGPTDRASGSQDVWFSRLARAHGKRIGVDLDLRVGHLCTKTNFMF